MIARSSGRSNRCIRVCRLHAIPGHMKAAFFNAADLRPVSGAVLSFNKPQCGFAPSCTILPLSRTYGILIAHAIIHIHTRSILLRFFFSCHRLINSQSIQVCSLMIVSILCGILILCFIQIQDTEQLMTIGTIHICIKLYIIHYTCAENESVKLIHQICVDVYCKKLLFFIYE